MKQNQTEETSRDKKNILKINKIIVLDKTKSSKIKIDKIKNK